MGRWIFQGEAVGQEMSAEIINWEDHQPGPVATCPECGGTEFHIRLDGYGRNWKKLLGTACTNPDCGDIINWVSKEAL